MTTALIESLENRRLCSATAMLHAVTRVVPFPNVIGIYTGSAVFTNGAVSAETLTFTKQKNGVFSGMTTQANGANGKLAGAITRTRKVHIIDRGTTIKFISTGNGTFINGMFAIKFVVPQGKQLLRGTLTLTSAAPV